MDATWLVFPIVIAIAQRREIAQWCRDFHREVFPERYVR